MTLWSTRKDASTWIAERAVPARLCDSKVDRLSLFFFGGAVALGLQLVFWSWALARAL